MAQPLVETYSEFLGKTVMNFEPLQNIKLNFLLWNGKETDKQKLGKTRLKPLSASMQLIPKRESSVVHDLE